MLLYEKFGIERLSKSYDAYKMKSTNINSVKK